MLYSILVDTLCYTLYWDSILYSILVDTPSYTLYWDSIQYSILVDTILYPILVDTLCYTLYWWIRGWWQLFILDRAFLCGEATSK